MVILCCGLFVLDLAFVVILRYSLFVYVCLCYGCPIGQAIIFCSFSLHDVWSSRGLVHYIPGIHFRGLLPPNRILPSAKFTLHPTLAFCYIGSVTAQHSSSGRVAITMGIGPHSSCVRFSLFSTKLSDWLGKNVCKMTYYCVEWP